MGSSKSFHVGDRVVLTGRFQQGQAHEFSRDTDIADALEEAFGDLPPCGVIVGDWGDGSRVHVSFDIKPTGGWRDDLITSTSVLAHEDSAKNEVTEEEVTEAIRSILGQSPDAPPAP